MQPTDSLLAPSSDTYIFELSGEHDTLPKAEVISLLDLGAKYEILLEDMGILVVKARKVDCAGLANRLSLSHYIDSHMLSSDLNGFLKENLTLDIPEGSFAVRAKRIQNSHIKVNLRDIEKAVADWVLPNRSVDLLKPNTEIRVIVSQQCHMGILRARIQRSAFEARKVQNRPFFSPVSLHPRLARALVNLAGVRPGEVLLDPFCGTGGVLLEAQLMGIKTIGSDIDKKMVQGCKRNLKSLNLDDETVFRSDIGKVGDNVGSVDAIATDPPYGRSATTNKEDTESLYSRAFAAFSHLLKKGRFLSIALFSDELVKTGSEYLDLVECHPVRVHRSLTRNFCVYQKP